MASKALRNTISVLALAEGCALVVKNFYENRPRNKTVMRLVERVERACEAAHRSWPQKIEMSEAERIGRIMAKAEQAAFANLGDREDFCTYASLTLGLLADLLESIKDSGRRAILEKLNSAMKGLNAYFDPALNEWTAYRKASNACTVWHMAMGA